MSEQRAFNVLIVLLVTAGSHAARSRPPSLPRFGAHSHLYKDAWAPNPHFRHAKEEQENFCNDASNRVKLPVHAELQSIQFEDVNFDMLIYPNGSQDYVSGSIRQNGAWEKEPSNLLLAAMRHACDKLGVSRESAVFLDIGANIGWYSLLFAASGFGVMSFEPMSANGQLLRRSICMNADFQDRLTYHTDLLSDRAHSNCTIYTNTNNVGDGTVTCEQDFSPDESVEVHAVGLDMTTLDSILDKVKSPIMVLKMDVEGHESLVLKGGISSIFEAEVPYLMFEFAPFWLKEKGEDPDGFLSMLVDKGYVIHTHSFEGPEFDVFAYDRGSRWENLYCVHKRLLS